MSSTRHTPLGPRGSGGLIHTAFYLGGMALLYIAERFALDSTTARLVLAALAIAGIFVGIVGRVLRRRSVTGQARAVESRLLLGYLVGTGALLLYLAQADFVMERLRRLFTAPHAAEHYQGALMALWPVIWVCAVTAIIFIEISYGGMSLERTIELGRIRRSIRSGLVLAMTVSLLFVLNYISHAFNKKVDLSYFKTTRPSESSKKMVRNLSAPLKVMLFFPGSNEVQEQAEAYFEELGRESSRFVVEAKDQVMEPELAKELGVSNNGSVVLVRDRLHQQIELGTTLVQARRKLKRLDSEFQSVFSKLMHVQKVAYLTVGHEERTEQPRDGVSGTSIRDLRTLLEKLNYNIRDLGIGQGLASEVPRDATLVIMAGPRKDFLPAELEALRRYLAQGGHLMAFLDPEAGLTFEPLLTAFGLKFTPTKLANDRFNVRMTYTDADRNVLYSNRFSAHPSVTTLTQNSARAVTVLLGAGYLDEIPPAGALKPQVQFTIHSMPSTWNDVNGNRVHDAGNEQRKVYELGAAVSMKLGQAPGPLALKNAPKQVPETRLLVYADSDMIGDQVFRNPGNVYLFLDGLRWLGGEEELAGETTSEEDIRIMHTRKEDQLWFYLTIFGVPALVLGGGLCYSRTVRRRRRS